MNSRAHIFQSFDALKGFRELLKQQEYIPVQKRILSEDDLAILDQKIHQVHTGQIITIEYFNGMDYVQTKGIVSKINLETKLLQIVKTKINLSTITNIELSD